MVPEYNNQPIITSRTNALFKKLLSLHTSKGIKQSGVFLAGGEKIIQEMMREYKERITAWIRAPDQPDIPPALTGVKAITLSKELFNELNLLGTTGPLLELRRPDMARFTANAPWPRGCTLFIPFGDPENIGAVIRSAVGLGASRIVLLREAACPFLPRAMRASAGSILRVRIESGPSLNNIAVLSGKIPLYSLDLRGQNLPGLIWPPTFGLIAGMEGKGLPAEVRRRCISVSIPLQNGLESLNAAAAVSIALWDWKTKER